MSNTPGVMLIPAFLCVLFLQDEPPAGPPPTPVNAVRVEARNHAPKERVTGSLEAVHSAALTAREAGPLIGEIPLVGARVAKDEVIARIDGMRLVAERARLDAELARARAMIAAAEARQTDARADYEALEAAREGDAISARELRVAKARVATAEADVEAERAQLAATEASLELLAIRIGDTLVRAPFDGVVTERFVETGEWVTPGSAIVRLVSDRDLQLRLDVPERFLRFAASSNESILATIDALGASFVARAPRVVPAVDPKTRMFPLMAVLEVPADRKALPTPGMSVVAQVPAGLEQRFVFIPKDALVYRPTGTSVMTVETATEDGANSPSATGTAAMVPVRVAFETLDEVAVDPAVLPAGTIVVVEGNERLFPGMPVQARVAVPGSRDSEPAPAPGAGDKR